MGLWSKNRVHFVNISGSSKSSKNISTWILANDKGGGIYVEGGSHPKNICDKGQILSNLFLVGKKDGGNRPVINLKNLNASIPYLHFKMEGLHLLKDILKEKDYVQDRPEGCLLLCSSSWKSSEVYQFCWEVCYTNSFVYVLAWDHLHACFQSYWKSQ